MAAMKSSIALVWVFLFNLSCCAQIFDYSKTFTQEELQSDFDSLKTVIEKTHPNAYNSYPYKTAMRDFDSIRALINQTMSALDFTWVLKHDKLSTFIRQETSSLITCLLDTCLHKLPNTKIELGVSYKKFYGIGATDTEKHGVIPDYETDPEEALNYTIKLLNNKNTK